MMLRHHHDIGRTGGLDRLHPLVRIELRRVEYLRVCRSIAPLAVEKSVRAKVEDDAKLQVLPLGLLRRGLHIHGILRLPGDPHGGQCGAGQNSPDQNAAPRSSSHPSSFPCQCGIHPGPLKSPRPSVPARLPQRWDRPLHRACERREIRAAPQRSRPDGQATPSP